MALEFTVPGTPVPQGSTRAFVFHDKVTKKPYAVVTSDNTKLKSWRKTLAIVAKEVSKEYEVPIQRGMPLAVTLKFYFARPKSYPQTGIAFKTTKPDIDKLVRAVLDGMTGVIYDDDSQVIRVSAEKHFGMPERVEISVGIVFE